MDDMAMDDEMWRWHYSAPEIKLLVRKEAATNPTSILCRRCQTIDFERIFQLKSDELDHPDTNSRQGVAVFDLGIVQQTSSKDCPLCMLWLESAAKTLVSQDRMIDPSGRYEPHWHLRAYKANPIFGSSHSSRWVEDSSAMLVLRPGEPSESANHEPSASYGSTDNCIAQLVSHDEKTALSDKPFSFVEKLEPQKADLGFVKRALQDCLLHHNCRTREASFDISDLQVIDCESRKLVRLPADARYITLSYVWGAVPEANVTSDQRSMYLPSMTPKTIEDSIALVLQLQERYLWVDRYCVDQVDLQKKAQQLADMGNIYATSLFTIVALGTDMNTGLYGVSSTPRIKQIVFEHNGKSYGSTGRSVLACFRQSIWSSRAWTYQESILTSRALYISQEQVHFVCQRGTMSEAVPWSSALDSKRHNAGEASTESTFSFAHDDATERELPLGYTLSRNIEEYSRRRLTFESDALNAFRGILSRSDFISWCGVTCYPKESYDKDVHEHGWSTMRCDHYFIAGLLWNTPLDISVKSDRPKQAEIPSWSYLSAFVPVTVSTKEGLWERNPDSKDVPFVAEPSMVEGKTGNVVALHEAAREAQAKRPQALMPKRDTSLRLGTYTITLPEQAAGLVNKAVSADKSNFCAQAFSGVPSSEMQHADLEELLSNVLWDAGAKFDPFLVPDGCLKATIRLVLIAITTDGKFTSEHGLPITSDDHLSYVNYYWLVVCGQDSSSNFRRLGVLRNLFRHGDQMDISVMAWDRVDLR